MTATPSSRLRIAIATIEFPPDPFSAGIGSYTKSVAELLAARGHTVHVVARGLDEDEHSVEKGMENGVNVHRITPGRPVLPNSLDAGAVAGLLGRALPSELRYRRKLVGTLSKLTADEGIDLIEVADHMAEAVAFPSRRFPRLPFVVRLHTPLALTERIDPNIPELARLGMRNLERRLLRKATHLSAPSKEAAEAILDELGLALPVTVYPNPPTLPPANSEPASSEDPHTVLFIGRINRIKGPHLLVEAIPGILAAFPRTRFLFVGSDNVSAGDYPSGSAYLRSLLPERFHDRLEFTGHVPHHEVERYYRQASLCVLPSLFESFGYTCLEAMGLGKAIVGSTAGGMAEMLDHGQAGLLFTPPDVAEL
ncbi:MAG: glycosyltransferase family 4 protein, partial [Trueperaceae bacterium]